MKRIGREGGGGKGEGRRGKDGEKGEEWEGKGKGRMGGWLVVLGGIDVRKQQYFFVVDCHISPI